MKITTLIDDGFRAGFENEHGLSLYIETGGKKILFDTGQTGAFLKNADQMNIDLRKLDYVILSHGHYDHSGGLKTFVETMRASFTLVVGEGFFNPKYHQKGNEYIFKGNNFGMSFCQDAGIPVHFITKDITYLNDELMIFRNFDCQNVNPQFKLNQDGKYITDFFKDEIVLGIKTNDGIFVVSGCSHNGIINILDTVTERTGLGISGLLGGIHLKDAPSLRIEAVISRLESVGCLGLCHCTGDEAMQLAKNKYQTRYFETMTGQTLEIT